MKFILVALLALTAFTQACSQAAITKCQADIGKSFAICEKAAKDGGKDMVADLECMKYVKKIERDCWPCICQIAKDNAWIIAGCTSATPSQSQ